MGGLGPIGIAVASLLNEYVQDRRHVGDLPEANAIGRSNLGGQAPHTTMYLLVRDNVVEQGRFHTSGCGFLIACCAAAIELCLNQSLETCKQLTPAKVREHLGTLPENRYYCAELAISALQDALEQSSIQSSFD